MGVWATHLNLRAVVKGKFELPSVKRKARGWGASVNAIAQEGPSQGSQVAANLVHDAGQDLHFDFKNSGGGAVVRMGGGECDRRNWANRQDAGQR